MRPTSLCRVLLLFIAILMTDGSEVAWGQAAEDSSFVTISGVVKDRQTRKRLEYVNISVPGTSVGTITNNDGEFTIKVANFLRARQVEVSHVGYLNSLIPLVKGDIEGVEVMLEPNTNTLDEVIVRAGEPRRIVEQAIMRIGSNYLSTGSKLTGFYRETAQKGRRYVDISEAVIEIYKSSYARRDVHRDRVSISKGRRLLSQRAKDTLAVKMLGGPNLSVYVDAVKNPDLLLDPEVMQYYSYRMEESVMIDERPQYVISFQPAAVLPYALYYGKLYIDKERLSFSRMEFFLSMDDRQKATEAILRRKPLGLRFKPIDVAFLVTYKERDGISYLSYIRNTVRFKCDWKRRLFSTNYTMVSEMVVTDGVMQDESIPYRMSFKPNQALSDRVNDFSDPDFWGAYNIIEPTESLENAVHKLKKIKERD